VKKLALLILLLCMFIGIVPITARILGPSNPVSLPVQLLGLINCDQPCVMGLTLGKTNFADAKQILATFQLPEGFEATVREVERDSGLPLLKVELSTQTAIDPIEMEFYFRNPDKLFLIEIASGSYSTIMPTLADLKGLYGTPRCAVSNGGYGGDYVLLPVIDSARTWSLDSRVDLFYAGGKPILAMPLAWNQTVTRLTYTNRADTILGFNFCGQCRWSDIAHVDTFLACNP
jgi:hypothetical protein